MIQEAYVSFETAKLLKEKEFNEASLYGYNNKAQIIGGGLYYSNDTVQKNIYTAPTQALVMKWLREVHSIFISIAFCTYPTKKRVTWIPEISTFDSVFPESAIEYDSYEQACEAAIKYCLEKLI
jgi:hypothetical protein